MDNDTCVFCRKRPATKLCDFPTGTVKTSIDFKPHRTTCDRPICEECSINIADDTEFCPHCMKIYQEKFINWQKELKEKSAKHKKRNENDKLKTWMNHPYNGDRM